MASTSLSNTPDECSKTLLTHFLETIVASVKYAPVALFAALSSAAFIWILSLTGPLFKPYEMELLLILVITCHAMFIVGLAAYIASVRRLADCSRGRVRREMWCIAFCRSRIDGIRRILPRTHARVCPLVYCHILCTACTFFFIGLAWFHHATYSIRCQKMAPPCIIIVKPGVDRDDELAAVTTKPRLGHDGRRWSAWPAAWLDNILGKLQLRTF